MTTAQNNITTVPANPFAGRVERRMAEISDDLRSGDLIRAGWAASSLRALTLADLVELWGDLGISLNKIEDTADIMSDSLALAEECDDAAKALCLRASLSVLEDILWQEKLFAALRDSCDDWGEEDEAMLGAYRSLLAFKTSDYAGVSAWMAYRIEIKELAPLGGGDAPEWTWAVDDETGDIRDDVQSFDTRAKAEEVFASMDPMAIWFSNRVREAESEAGVPQLDNRVEVVLVAVERALDRDLGSIDDISCDEIKRKSFDLVGDEAARRLILHILT